MIPAIKGKSALYVLVILTGGIILCFAGWYNNYPIFNLDSPVYIYPAFQFYAPKDRPIIYGLFVRLFSLNYSLWLAMLAQGIALSLSIFYYFHYLTSRYTNHWPFLICIFILAFLSSASLHVSVILPDIFTSIAILNLGLLFFVHTLKRLNLVLISLLFMLSLAVHNSHFALVGLLLIIFTILSLIKNLRAKHILFNFRRLALIFSLFILSFLFSAGIHYMLPRTGEYVYGHFFSAGQGGSIFLVSKLNQIGILEDFLEENCDRGQYKLCDYKDSIPRTLDFLWSNESPLEKTGGWHANKEEFNRLIFDILTTPKYTLTYAYKSLESSAVLFFSFNSGDMPVIKEYKFADDFINACYPAYTNEYLESRQNNNLLNPLVHRLNHYQTITFALSMFCLLLILFSRATVQIKWISSYFLLALYSNALICGALSAIDSRYQSRVVWLLVIPVLLAFSNQRILSLSKRAIHRRIFGKQNQSMIR